MWHPLPFGKKIDGIIGIGGGDHGYCQIANQLIHSEFPINRYLAPDFATPTPGVPLVLIPHHPGTGSGDFFCPFP